MTEKERNEIEDINAQIDGIDDPRECYALVRNAISEHESAGEMISDDLAMLERTLLTECLVESQGR